jgi:hypothetical protein
LFCFPSSSSSFSFLLPSRRGCSNPDAPSDWTGGAGGAAAPRASGGEYFSDDDDEESDEGW